MKHLNLVSLLLSLSSLMIGLELYYADHYILFDVSIGLTGFFIGLVVMNIFRNSHDVKEPKT